MSGGSPQLKDPLIQTGESLAEAEASLGLHDLDHRPQTAAADGVDSPSAVVVQGKNMPLFSAKRAGASWRLKYQDFVPFFAKQNGCDNTDPFRTLVERANEWLQKNPGVQVKTCETLTWMENDVKRLGDSESVVLTKFVAEGAQTHYLRGLRLWLMPRTNSKCQTLCFCDIIPEGADNVISLVNKANKKFERNNLKGRVLTIESVSVAVTNGNIGTGETRWTDSVDEDSPYAYILRIYYDKEENTKAAIGLKDFIPLPSEDGYEGFDDLTDKANTWLKDQSDILVTNMQSVMVQKDEGPHSETGNACFYTMPGLQQDNPTEFFRILRVAFIKPTSDAGTDFPIIYPFTYEIFTPQLVVPKSGSGKERMEKMRENFVRLSSFLKSSGAEIISCETVMNPMQIVPQNAQTPPIGNEIKWLLTLRLYFTDTCTPASPSQQNSNQFAGRLEFNPAGSARKSARKKSADGHPGPIFLGSVVTRRYKYRWLVAGLTVSTCMAIIVVVSVVYGNVN